MERDRKETARDKLPPRSGPDHRVAGIVLAGGRATRFGGADKALQVLGGRTLLERAVSRLQPQVEVVVISANADPRRYPELGLDLVADDVPGSHGPLAGLAAGTSWLRAARPDLRWVATVPVDVPFFPADLVSRLAAAAMPANVPAIAVCGGQPHPVFGLWPVGLEGRLRRYLTADRRARFVDIARGEGAIEVEFPREEPRRFFNVNTPADLATAERIATGCERATGVARS